MIHLPLVVFVCESEFLEAKVVGKAVIGVRMEGKVVAGDWDSGKGVLHTYSMVLHAYSTSCLPLVSK